jgi:hypothetical protein
LPPRSLGFWLNGVILRIFTLFVTIPFCILTLTFFYPFVKWYGHVQSVENFRRIPCVSNNTWSPTLYSWRIWLISLFSFWLDLLKIHWFHFYLITFFSEGSILDHISAKRELTSYCQLCCVIGASNNLVLIDNVLFSLVTIPSTEGINQIKVDSV